MLCLHLRASTSRHDDGKNVIISNSEEPTVGSLAPDFVLYDARGHYFKLSSQKGHSVVLAFFCGCDRCQRAAQRISVLQRQDKFLAVVSVVALNPEGAEYFVRKAGLKGTVLSDLDESVGSRYASSFCPRLWKVSPVGLVSYRTGIALEGGELDQALVDLGRSNSPYTFGH